jgi:hypothetical protein
VKREGGRHETPTLGLYAIALAILVVGLVALGVPASTLLFGALALACPLMMMLMMGGTHRGHGGQDQTGEHGGPSTDGHDHQPTTGRRQLRPVEGGDR